MILKNWNWKMGKYSKTRKNLYIL